MLVSELINELEDYNRKHGDKPVSVTGEEECEIEYLIWYENAVDIILKPKE